MGGEGYGRAALVRQGERRRWTRYGADVTSSGWDRRGGEGAVGGRDGGERVGGVAGLMGGGEG